MICISGRYLIWKAGIHTLWWILDYMPACPNSSSLYWKSSHWSIIWHKFILCCRRRTQCKWITIFFMKKFWLDLAFGPKRYYEYEYVLIFKISSDVDGQYVRVKEIHRHEKWDSVTVNYDYAILTLREPLQFSDKVQVLQYNLISFFA